MSRKKIWIKVSADAYELPEIVTDTAREMAEKTGVCLGTILSAVNHTQKRKPNENGKKGRYRKYACVDLIEDDEEDEI